MVKLRGPGLAQDASGSLGGVLVFSNNRGRSYAKKLTAPKQPRPASQVSSRAALSFLTERWATLNAFQQTSWGFVKAFPELDPYHKYIHENLRTWHLGQAPSKAHPATRLGALQTWNSWNLNAQGRRTEHSISVNTMNAGWAAIIFRSTSPVSGNSFDLAIRLIALPGPGNHDFWDGPLTSGTWYYRARRITVDGRLSDFTASRSVVIP